MEDRLQQLERTACSQDEVRRRYGDIVKVYNALHEDVFDAKRKLYDVGTY